jgi:hypothetical protein
MVLANLQPGLGLVWPWQPEFWQILIPRVEHPFTQMIPLTAEEKAAFKQPTGIPVPSVPEIGYTGQGYTSNINLPDTTVPGATDWQAVGLSPVPEIPVGGGNGGAESGIPWWLIGLAAGGVLLIVLRRKR